MTSYDDVLRHGLKVLDRLHALLTAEELSDGWRDELDTAIAVAASLLDQADQLATDEPHDATPTTADRDGKRCPRCDTTKPTGEFGANRTKRDRLQSYCKACVREMNRSGRRAGRARRLPQPTGQPPEPEPDTPTPVHAAGPRGQHSTEVLT
jgi:hypothetical protein